MKTDLRVAVTKRMIQEALMRLLKDKPLDKIKVNELCEESGVNRATFYRHYETLQDVLREIEVDFIRQMPHPDKSPRTIDEAKIHMETVCTYMYDQSEIMKILFQNRTDEDMLQSMSDFYRNYLRNKHKEPPFLRPDEDTIQILIALLGGGCHCLMKKWIMGDIRKTPKELAAILCNMIRLQESFEWIQK